MVENMKANRKFIEEKDGVSVVVGIILLVCVVAAIAAILYIYVSQYYEKERLTVEGTVQSVVESGVYEDPSCAECNDTIYNITLDGNESYLMLFRTDAAVVPPINVELCFYYDLVDGYYDVYKIKSL
ncbi:unnamed protein product [marine sediment metagenome]|uniref:Archaeal Type IV pilin N-terminal domain-containing protein n=1 Tax=marine sediment metagenome TaxID=412755 RepID=X1A134_9ZZZZ